MEQNNNINPLSFNIKTKVKEDKIIAQFQKIVEEQPFYEVMVRFNAPFNRLPRKLKKAAKGVWCKLNDEIVTKRLIIAYSFKRNTKWKRKAYSWLMKIQIQSAYRPILKIPHFTQEEIEKGLREWQGHVMPYVEEPERMILLDIADHD